MNNTKYILIMLLTLACYGCNVGNSTKTQEQKINSMIPDGNYSGHIKSTVSVHDPIPIIIKIKSMSTVVTVQGSTVLSGNFSTDPETYKNTAKVCFEGTYANKPVQLKHCSLTNHDQDQDILEGHWYFYGIFDDFSVEFDSVNDDANTYSDDVIDDNTDD
jgi:hypothetical protein